MSTAERVRQAVARRVWRTNPHSAVLAGVAVELAQLADRHPAHTMLRLDLRRVLSHLADCQATPDDLDEIRATFALHTLDLHREHAPTVAASL